MSIESGLRGILLYNGQWLVSPLVSSTGQYVLGAYIGARQMLSQSQRASVCGQLIQDLLGVGTRAARYRA